MKASPFELARGPGRIVATGLAAVAIAGYGERADARPSAGYTGAGIETISNQETALNPKKVAEQVIFQMNNDLDGLYPNQVYGGAILVKQGSFVNIGPVAAVERAKTKIPGTGRVPKDTGLLLQMPRVVRYQGIPWAIGFSNDTRPGSALRTDQLRWINLKTAKYDTYGYMSPNNPNRFVTPKLLDVKMNPDADLQLLDPFSAVGKPPILQLMTSLQGKAVIKHQLDYIGLKDLHDRFKPNPQNRLGTKGN